MVIGLSSACSTDSTCSAGSEVASCAVVVSTSACATSVIALFGLRPRFLGCGATSSDLTSSAGVATTSFGSSTATSSVEVFFMASTFTEPSRARLRFCEAGVAISAVSVATSSFAPSAPSPAPSAIRSRCSRIVEDASVTPCSPLHFVAALHFNRCLAVTT